MAYDEKIAERMRKALAPRTTHEVRMFSGLTFMPLTGVDGGLYVAAVDRDSTIPAFMIEVTGYNVGNGPLFTVALGGASVSWFGGP